MRLARLGTEERERLETEALRFAYQRLELAEGRPLSALYETYDHFRQRFLQAGHDNPAGDARRLEAHVAQVWTRILFASAGPEGH